MGKLELIDKRDNLKFPFKSYQYNIMGELENISLHVSIKDTYVFEVNGRLVAHWLDDKCYDINGQMIKERY